MILSRIDRYVGRSVLVGTALVLAVVTAITTLFALVDVLPDYGRGNFDTAALVRYVVLSQARKLYEIFPVVTLIGTLLGLSALALGSELTAMRAAGISTLRILGAAMKTGVALVVASALFGEFVVPVAENAAQLGRARALETSLQKKGSGLWLREGQRYVNIGEVLPDLSLLRVSVFEVDENLRLRGQTFAQRAVYVPEDKAWRLIGVRDTALADDRLSVQRAGERMWHASLTPEMVNVFSVKPEGLSIMQLARYVEHLRKNGQDTARYRLAFWQKLLLPLATAMMILLAAPFVFQHFRSGGMSKRLFIGVLLGLVFVVLNRTFGFFGLLYGLPPVLGAGMPLLLFFLLALYSMRRVA
jgi:lipopolysaccharide export system permease protein